MNQISPQKEFVIVWNGSDPNDTSTLYVQAKVQDAHTLAVLNTVNLTDGGSHMFAKGFITPADPSQLGTGRQIVITTTVYTDAGYTVPSQNYSRVSNDYLVKTLVDASSFWGAGGPSVDMKEIKKAVREALAENPTPEPPEPTEYPEVDVESLKKDILKGIEAIVSEHVGGIPTPEKPEKVDLSSLDSSLSAIMREIRSQPKFRDADLSPVIAAINALAAEARSANASQDARIAALFDRFKEEIVKEFSDENARMKLVDGIRSGSVSLSASSPEQDAKRNALMAIKSRFATK